VNSLISISAKDSLKGLADPDSTTDTLRKLRFKVSNNGLDEEVTYKCKDS